MKAFILSILASLGIIGGGSLMLGAPNNTFQRDIYPETDSTYTLGSTTLSWLNVYTDELCLAGDCETTWPSGGSSSLTDSFVGFGAPDDTVTGTSQFTFNSTTLQLTVPSVSSTNATSTNLSALTSFNFLGTLITNVSTWFNGLFDTQLATKDTGDLTEGSNLYYTEARVQSELLDGNNAVFGNVTSSLLFSTSSLFVGVTTTDLTVTNDIVGDITGNAGTVTNGLYTTDVGSVVQAFDTDLTTWAGITPGTGVGTALAVNVGSAGAFVVNGGALGTPSSGTVTNLTGTASININGTVGATTPSTGGFTTITATSTSNVLRLVNNTDNASVQVASFEGDRATVTDGDEAYISLKLSDDSGSQSEFGRITWDALDVNVGNSLDAEITFSVIGTGAMKDVLDIEQDNISPSKFSTTPIDLGKTSAPFDDIRLDDGSQIRFDNDVSLTHSTDLLTLTGGNFTVVGTVSSTNGLFTYTTSTNAFFSSSTSTNANITNALVVGGDLTLSGALSIAGEISLDGLPDTDHTAVGNTTDDYDAGATVAAIDLLYMASDGEWALADASASTTGQGMLAIALEAGTDNNPLNVALPGSFVRDDTWNWTIGSMLFMSETTGAITDTAPTTTPSVIRAIGYATTADVIWFDPDQTIILNSD